MFVQTYCNTCPLLSKESAVGENRWTYEPRFSLSSSINNSPAYIPTKVPFGIFFPAKTPVYMINKLVQGRHLCFYFYLPHPLSFVLTMLTTHLRPRCTTLKLASLSSVNKEAEYTPYSYNRRCTGMRRCIQ